MGKIYCFRHAQASYLSDNYDKLSPLGESQALALGKYLHGKEINFDRVYVGPLVRQVDTCKIVGNSLNGLNGKDFPTPIKMEALREHEGPQALRKALPNLLKSVAQLQKWHAEMEADPSLQRRNSLLSFEYFITEWVDGKIQVPDVEPWLAFRSKVSKGLATILEAAEKGENIALFTSGGTIAALVGEVMKLQDQKQIASLNFNCRNSSISSFLFSPGRLSLLSFNEVPHLPEEMHTFV